MKNKLFNILSIMFFAAVLCAPIMWHLLAPKSENLEKRNLADLPQWPKNWTEVETSKSQLVDYLEDNFGLRTTLIKRANQFNYYVFGEVTSPQVTMGKAGFIYFNSHSKVAPNAMTKEVCGQVNPSDDRKRSSRQGIEKFIAHYQQQGIKTLFIVIPTKARIYPEYLPPLENSWCLNDSQNWIDQLIPELDNENFLYPIKLFKSWKENFQVYLPKYFHWNGVLPKQTAEMIMSLWNIDVEIQVTSKELQVRSDLGNHLPGLTLKDSSVKYRYENLKLCHEKGCVESFTDTYKNGSAMVAEMNGDNGRRLLILGDSFTPQITPHFSQGFDRAVSVNLNHLQKSEENEFFSWIVDFTQPTHIIYLVHDGGLLWQALRLDRIMSSW